MRCKRVRLSVLKVGAILIAPIVDPAEGRLKLLGSGIEITPTFLMRLKTRGIESVILSERDLAVLTAFETHGRRSQVPAAPNYVQSNRENDASQQMDACVQSGDLVTESLPGESQSETDSPIVPEAKRDPGSAYADGLKRQWAIENDGRTQMVLNFFDEALESQDSSVDPLHQAAHELIDRLMEDADALVCLATSPHESQYPSRHGVHTASLAIAIGTDMGLNRDQLADLGIGCMMHDVGMRAVGTIIFDSNKPLNPAGLRRLADHPVMAIEIAEKYGDSLSLASRAVLYQLHERCDGTGYPRGCTRHQIHPLARIAAVADAFIGMAGNRKHRLAIQGYHAVLALMNDAQNQKHCPSVLRSLLRILSLHPIGSFVELNNQYVGRVIRTGGDDYVRPTIEMWHPRHRETPPSVVDLAQETSLRIVRSLPAAA